MGVGLERGGRGRRRAPTAATQRVLLLWIAPRPVADPLHLHHPSSAQGGEVMGRHAAELALTQELLERPAFDYCFNMKVGGCYRVLCFHFALFLLQ